MALNNCVLSNTTIFAESPAESEVQMILQHLGSGGGGAWRGGAAKVPSQLTFILQRLIGIECLDVKHTFFLLVSRFIRVNLFSAYYITC